VEGCLMVEPLAREGARKSSLEPGGGLPDGWTSAQRGSQEIISRTRWRAAWWLNLWPEREPGNHLKNQVEGWQFLLHRTKCRVVTLKVQKLVGGMQKGSKKQTVFLFFIFLLTLRKPERIQHFFQIFEKNFKDFFKLVIADDFRRTIFLPIEIILNLLHQEEQKQPSFLSHIKVHSACSPIRYSYWNLVLSHSVLYWRRILKSHLNFAQERWRCWRGGGGGEWLERLTAHANIATGLSSIPAQWNLNEADVVFNFVHKIWSNRLILKKGKWHPYWFWNLPPVTVDNTKKAMDRPQSMLNDNGHFLAYIPSWWRNQPRLVGGGASPPLSPYLPSRPPERGRYTPPISTLPPYVLCGIDNQPWLLNWTPIAGQRRLLKRNIWSISRGVLERAEGLFVCMYVWKHGWDGI
jgi:hypothetical protein